MTVDQDASSDIVSVETSSEGDVNAQRADIVVVRFMDREVQSFKHG